jgi:hypothetical protein
VRIRSVTIMDPADKNLVLFTDDIEKLLFPPRMLFDKEFSSLINGNVYALLKY